MRIAVVNADRRVLGGVETYLARLLPALAARGHEVALWHEAESAGGRAAIELPPGAPAWCAAGMGTDRALAALREWRPDVLFAHGLRAPAVEAATLAVAPAVFFAHSYYGACISGGKTFTRLRPRACDRRFGPACLLHYFPHGCGGRSPVTMAREYRRQAARRDLLAHYRAVVVASAHMAKELGKNGLRPAVVGLPVEIPPPAETFPARSSGTWQLAFLGRMEPLKGGAALLAALPAALAVLEAPLRVVLAGDGPARAAWQATAERLVREHPGLEVRFEPWLDPAGRDELLAATDLLVLPSLWPEPFGLSGLEASARGIPVAAFAVGGIAEWLEDGVNGALAVPGSPAALAAAIADCLSDPARLERLRRGARERARRFGMDAHLAALLPVLERAAGGGAP